MASYTPQDAEATLKPILEKYFAAANSQQWDQVEEFYHPNAVAVQTDKEAVFGKKDIIASFKKFAEGTGKSGTTMSNDTYQGVGDYLIVNADFVAETEKAGTVKGKFVQIWKKLGERFVVYHDEYEVTA